MGTSINEGESDGTERARAAASSSRDAMRTARTPYPVALRNGAVVDARQVDAGQASGLQGTGEPLQHAVLVVAQYHESGGDTIVRRGPETGDSVIG
jgi:hypothetical protein